MSEWTTPPFQQPEFGPSSAEVPPPFSNGETASPEELVSSRSPSPPPAPNPGQYTEPTQSRGALTGLIWLFSFLVVIYFVMQMALPIVREYRYATVYGEEKARVQAAIEGLAAINDLGTPDISKLSTASRWVAQAVSPSVVHISTSRKITRTNASPGRSGLFAHPSELRSLGQGSGVVVDAEGYILTNNHVIEGAERIMVHTSGGSEFPAKVVGFDTLTDLAVLKVESDKLIPAQWGDSDKIQPGDMVWAFGSPFGLEQSVTFGIVSAKGRTQQTQSQFQEYLQTDVAVNPGNSGGPLVGIDGKIVGVNTAIVGVRYQGISFAVPSAIAKYVYDRIRSDGRVARGMLGVRFTAPISRDDDSTDGALIALVIRNSPADLGGISKGDVIVGWNGKSVDNSLVLSQLVANTEIGATVSIELLRAGKRKTVKVTVGDHSDIEDESRLRFRE